MSAVLARGPMFLHENLFCSFLETSAEMTKHVLLIPPQVTGHALELRQERVKAPSSAILL